ncbi:12813_t:CDS:1, partial [Funneliformis mosseae]
CNVKKYNHTCQGVKVCEYLRKDLKDKIHTEVDMDYDFIQTPNEILLD